jgi:hypothetical protein
MYLATGYIHPYEGDADVRSQCRIRLYLPTEDTDAAVVICSELANNPGTSVTNAAEIIAADVIAHFRLPLPPVWIEHYPPETTNGEEETFHLVVFDHYDVRKILRGRSLRKEIGPPTRKPLDRAAVEMLVGQHV